MLPALILPPPLTPSPSLTPSLYQEHKLRCPDYQGCDADAAFRDFSARIANYKKAYETLSLDLDRELTFIRVSNITQFHINNVNCKFSSSVGLGLVQRNFQAEARTKKPERPNFPVLY